MTDELRAKFEETFPHLDFSADSYGNYYSQRTLDHLYGWQAAHASRDAEVEALKRDAEIIRMELQRERAKAEHLVNTLSSIHALLYPAPIQSRGQIFIFAPPEDKANEFMRELSRRIRKIPEAIDAAMAKESGE